MHKSSSFFVLAAFAISAAQAQQDRIGTINPSQLMVLQGCASPQARPQDDQGQVDPSFKLPYMTLMLKPSEAQQTALRQLLSDQHDTASPKFHRWLTPEGYADNFGMSSGDMVKIAAWLKSAGFTIEYTARGRDFISFSGTAAQVEAALHVSVHRYRVNGESHFAITADPSIPAALGAVAQVILGLHDFYLKPAHSGSIHNPRPDCTGCNEYSTYSLAPGDLYTIYDLNPLYESGYDGSGQSIVIVGETDLDLSDIQNFRSTFGLANQNVQTVLAGTDPGINSDALGEADLDIEWAGAIAPNAQFYYVYSTDVDVASFYAIDQNLAPVLSESWGGCEPNLSPAAAPTYESEAQKANSLGITWLASSDDTGAAGCDPHGASAATLGLAVQVPSSIPEVTAVGGTEFNESYGIYWSPSNGNFGGSAVSYIPEVAWNDTAFGGGIAAGGGGVSILYAKPSWQSGAGVPNDGARDVPDVAMDASADHDPYNIYTAGQWTGVGGTSVATPVFAGIIAILNQYLAAKGGQTQGGAGNINTVLYGMAHSAPSAFHDVVFGNNIVPCEAGTTDCTNGEFGYTAGVGYDLVTGLGSVDAYNLISNWSGASASKLAIASVSPSSATAGGPAFTLTVKGSNFTSSSTVNWNGTPLTTTYVGSSELQAAVTASLIASAGTVALTVSSGTTVSGAFYFTINPAAAPAVTLTDARVTTQAPPSAGCVLPPSVTTVATSVNTVYLYFAASVTANDSLSNDWLAPDGTVTTGDTWPAQAGDFCFTGASLAVAGFSGAKLGSWNVRVYDNGNLLQSIPFTVSATSSTVPVISSVKNAASYAAGVVSPGEIVVLFGSGMGPAQISTLTLNSQGLVSTTLAGTSVQFNGVAAPMIYTLAGQVAAVVPYEVTGSSAQVTVTYQNQTSAPFPVTVASAVPALFTSNASGTGAVAALNQDSSVNSLTKPAAPGSVVVLFATGEGQTSPAGVDGKLAAVPLPKPVQPVTVTIGGQTAQTLYVGGAPGEVAGVLQINAVIPAGVFGSAVPVTIQVGNAQSAAGTTISVAAPAGQSVFTVTSDETAASVSSNSNGSLNCIAPAAQTSFPTSSPYAWLYMTFSGAQQGDVLSFNWVHPSGAVDSSQPTITLNFSGAGCAAESFAIQGAAAASEPGTWQVRVFHNGTFQFSLSFSIVAQAASFSVTAKETAGSLITDSNGNPEYCSMPTPKTSFLTTDPQVFVWFTYDGAVSGDVFTFQWIHPSGTVDSYQPTSVLNFNGSGCTAWSFQIAGAAPSNDPGTWQVQVLRNGSKLFSLPFVIAVPTGNSFSVVTSVLSPSVVTDASGGLVCQTPPSQTVYYTTSYAVYAYVAFNGAQTGDLLTFKWIQPNGQEDLVDSGSFPINFEGSGCAAWGLGIYGYTAGTEPGSWQVGVYLNGTFLYSQPFTIDN